MHGFRYFLVGEYGSKKGRPHYHAAIFPGDPFWEIEELLSPWRKRRGNTSCHPLEAGSAEYLIMDITTKKLTQPDDPRLAEGQEPEFRTSSRAPAIGSAAIEPIASAYETRSGARVLAERGDVERVIRLGKRKWPLDPYMLRKLRIRLGIPLTHEDRMNHEGYRLWHETPEMEQDLPMLQYQETRHAKKKARLTAPF